MADANLRRELIKHLPRAQWTSVETGATAQGVPDAEFQFPITPLCHGQGWVECKRSLAWAVTVRPEQAGWLLRRSRLGGRCFIAVRRLNRGADELWLFYGSSAAEIGMHGLKSVKPLYRGEGGPDGWDWKTVEAVLKGA